MFPPHLPPPSSSLNKHRQWERVKIAIYASLFGVVSGFAGAAIMLGWIIPNIGDTAQQFIAKTQSESRDVIAVRSEQKIADKIYSIYQKSTSAGDARYFSDADKIGDGIMGVTSGWLVAYLPKFSAPDKNWLAVSPDGGMFSIGSYLFDKRTGFAFFKISPLQKNYDAQFKVVTFSGGLERYDRIYVLDGGRWQSTVNLGLVHGNMDTHLDSVYPLLYNISDSFKDGSVAVNSSGDVIGFVSGRTAILPLASADYYLNGIDQKSEITYPSLGVEGWFSDEKMIVLGNEKVTGFLVTKVNGNRAHFVKSDIILEVNGRPADWFALWNAVQGDTVSVTLWRNGKSITENVPVVKL